MKLVLNDDVWEERLQAYNNFAPNSCHLSCEIGILNISRYPWIYSNLWIYFTKINLKIDLSMTMAVIDIKVFLKLPLRYSLIDRLSKCTLFRKFPPTYPTYNPTRWSISTTYYVGLSYTRRPILRAYIWSQNIPHTYYHARVIRNPL